jgi:hypothetical protein
MYIEFLYEIQIGKDNFKDILGKEVDRANRKRGRKRKHTDTEIELKKRRLSGDHLNEDGTRESSQETDETGHYRRLNSVDSLPSSEEAEDSLNFPGAVIFLSITSFIKIAWHSLMHTSTSRIPKYLDLSAFGISLCFISFFR